MEVTTAERFASGGPGKGLYAENLPLAFRATVERLGDDPAIAWFAGDEQESMSWNEVADRVRRIAGGFAKLGVGKGDTVAMMLNNRPEFIPMDLGAVSLGAVPFSIYQTSSPEQIQYVVADAGAKVAVVEKVRGAPVPFRVMERASVVGFVLVLMLFAVGLSNDIDRLTGEGFDVR